jgi:hypothetical protein
LVPALRCTLQLFGLNCFQKFIVSSFPAIAPRERNASTPASH